MFRRVSLSACFLLVFLAGCVISPRRGGTVSGGGGGGGGTPTGKLYVSNDSQSSILRFDNGLTVNGNVAPAATISGTATLLHNPQYILLDTAADRLFVANLNGSNILIWEQASTRTGNIAPTRTISSAGLFAPTDLALDKGRDLLYVADGTHIFVFTGASIANGVVSAARDIVPGFSPGAIHLDATNDRLFAADPATNSVTVFDNASTLNGSVSGNRRLVGAATGLAQPFGLRIDGLGRLVVSNAAPVPSITIYNSAATVNGNLAPAATISGSNTGLAGPTENSVNTSATNGELYVADPFGGKVEIFANLSSANGNIAPTRTISGANTTLNGGGSATARGVAIDPTR